MTRNDFQIIAATLNHNAPRRSSPRARLAWLRLVNDLGVALARTNPRFDSRRFYAACGLGADEERFNATGRWPDQE